MRIAYVVSDFSIPPREGLHEQTYLLLQELRHIGTSVDVLGYIHSSNVTAEAVAKYDMPPIARRDRSVVRALRNRLYLGRSARALLCRLVSGGYDVVHLEGAAACGLLRRRIRARSIVSLVDPGSIRWLRSARDATGVRARSRAAVGYMLVRLLEMSLARGTPTWHVVSPHDAVYVRRLYPSVRCTQIPVMLPRRVLIGGSPTPVETSGLAGTGALILGDLRLPYLREALIRFLTCLEAKGGEVSRQRITILSGPSELGNVIGFTGSLCLAFLEWVPDYGALLRSADFVIALDTEGAGLKNRVVQSMGSGKAVIGTSVAFEGIPITDGVSGWIADDSIAQVAAFEAMIHADALRQEMGRRARTLALAHYSPWRVSGEWLDLYSRVLAQP